MLLRVRVMPVARLYVSAGRALRSLGGSGIAFRFERTLQGALVSERVEGVLLGLGTAALCFLLAYAIFVLVYCQVGFSAIGVG